MAFAGIVSLALLASPIVAAPTTRATKLDVQSFGGETTGKYIVKLKGSSDKASVMGGFSSFSDSTSANITHEWKPKFFNGFAGEFDDAALDALRANSDVESIVEDGIMKAFATVEQSNAPWGLSRISQNGAVSGGDASALDYSYSYDDTAGEGVDVYVVDTGILTTHEEFEGRASWGATFGGYEDADGNGHGTHCAGTVGSAAYGVAKKANLFAVKVLSDEGSGSTADIVSGLEFVGEAAEASGNPSVVSMSLGGGTSSPLDDAVSALIASGVHVVVAAGNDGTDAGSTSPARVPEAITVGASDVNDEIAYFSNYGEVVDIFGPGVDIISTWNTDDTATNSISGTSMATPHVAGLVAYLIGHNGNSSPEAMSAALKDLATSDAISGVPWDTVNLLSRNDI